MSKEVSNPFIAGHSFLQLRSGDGASESSHVSNPFIAGHSFLHTLFSTEDSSFPGFKPLHSGAFLLTLGLGVVIDVGYVRFKPLHSGAFLLTLLVA